MHVFSLLLIKLQSWGQRSLGVGGKRTLLQPWNDIIFESIKILSFICFSGLSALRASGSDWVTAYFKPFLRFWHIENNIQMACLDNHLNSWCIRTQARAFGDSQLLPRFLEDWGGGVQHFIPWTHWLGNAELDNRCLFPFSLFPLKCHLQPPSPPSTTFRALSPCPHLSTIKCSSTWDHLGVHAVRREAEREGAEARKTTGVAHVKPRFLLWLVIPLATTLLWGLFNGNTNATQLGSIFIVNCLAFIWSM